jgi:hypothetical protein
MKQAQATVSKLLSFGQALLVLLSANALCSAAFAADQPLLQPELVAMGPTSEAQNDPALERALGIFKNSQSVEIKISNPAKSTVKAKSTNYRKNRRVYIMGGSEAFPM